MVNRRCGASSQRKFFDNQGFLFFRRNGAARNPEASPRQRVARCFVFRHVRGVSLWSEGLAACIVTSSAAMSCLNGSYPRTLIRGPIEADAVLRESGSVLG